MRIGVLALQGDFARHAQALARLGVAAPEVRTPGALGDLDGLVIPGGESTTLLKLMGDAFPPALRAFHAAGKPIYGTCAGLILLAREVVSPRQPSLGRAPGASAPAHPRARKSDRGRIPFRRPPLFRRPRIRSSTPRAAPLTALRAPTPGGAGEMR